LKKNSFYKIVKSKKIGLIVFARMSSKRFPGKVMHKIFKNQSIIDIILDNLKKAKLLSNTVIATTKNKSDKKIVEYCKSKNIKCFKGNNQNVFLRTADCIKKYKFNYFVRICADRPLFDIRLMKNMIKLILLKNYDIVTNVNPRTYPKGLTCEVAKTNIFKSVNKIRLSSIDKEHIFNYFYKKKTFKIYNISGNFNKKFLNQNFCIDNKSDMKKIINILIKFSKIKKNISSEQLFKLSKRGYI
jgi:spore coat polysaccharide biosynthesis protein SpsF (cytidylyltransferase family)